MFHFPPFYIWQGFLRGNPCLLMQLGVLHLEQSQVCENAEWEIIHDLGRCLNEKIYRGLFMLSLILFGVLCFIIGALIVVDIFEAICSNDDTFEVGDFSQSWANPSYITGEWEYIKKKYERL